MSDSLTSDRSPGRGAWALGPTSRSLVGGCAEVTSPSDEPGDLSERSEGRAESRLLAELEHSIRMASIAATGFIDPLDDEADRQELMADHVADVIELDEWRSTTKFDGASE